MAMEILWTRQLNYRPTAGIWTKTELFRRSYGNANYRPQQHWHYSCSVIRDTQRPCWSFVQDLRRDEIRGWWWWWWKLTHTFFSRATVTPSWNWLGFKVKGSEFKVTGNIFQKCIFKRQRHTHRRFAIDFGKGKGKHGFVWRLVVITHLWRVLKGSHSFTCTSMSYRPPRRGVDPLTSDNTPLIWPQTRTPPLYRGSAPGHRIS